jgi:hypothetical protein
MSGSIDDAFPGAWYESADRPSSPSAARMAWQIDDDRIQRAAWRVAEARPRRLHPAAVSLLQWGDRERGDLLAPYGGVAGYMEIADAAAFVTWALLGLEALLVTAGAWR